MKYYKFTRSLKRKDVGIAFGQTSEIYDLGSINTFGWLKILEALPNYHGKLKNNEFPKIEPRIKFELTEKGKLTDLVDIPNMNANGMLISPKFKKLLESFNLMEHRFYPGQLMVGAFFLEYFWFHPVGNMLDFADLQKSQIIIPDENENEIIVTDNNYSENKDYYMRISKIYLKHEFPKHDLFFIPYINHQTDFFISEQLMQAIKKEKITGIEILEQDILFVE